MPDPGKTMRELARVLRSDGKAVITSLKHKHSQKQLEAWTTAADLEPLKVGEIPGSEDVICVARRS
jgi:ubiquinone/menaquinone biosynthesis C-methylase UbiE